MIKFALLIVLILVAWFAWGWAERRSIYFPDRTLFANPGVYRLSYEEVQLATADGAKIHGWYIPGAKPVTILLCHGNAGNISHRLDKAMRLHQSGAGLLLFDYRGYGRSEGTPSEQGAYRDAEAAYRYLTETRRLAPDQIVLYGESLGGAVAIETALRHPVGAVILESPFTSTVAMAKIIFPWLPARWIVRNRYDNLAKIPRLRAPLLILHSPQDEIVPFEMGRQLYAAASGPKTFFELKGNHNEGYAETGNRYMDAVARFLRRFRGYERVHTPAQNYFN